MSSRNGGHAESQPLLQGSSSQRTNGGRVPVTQRAAAAVLFIVFLVATGVSLGLYIHNRDVVQRDPYKAALAILDRYPLLVRANSIALIAQSGFVIC